MFSYDNTFADYTILSILLSDTSSNDSSLLQPYQHSTATIASIQKNKKAYKKLRHNTIKNDMNIEKSIELINHTSLEYLYILNIS